MELFYPLMMLLVLSFLVVIHELGHFLAARWMKVDVEVFAIGWGPAFYKRQGKNTEFRLCVFPLGGYCKMKGEKFLLSGLEKDGGPQSPETGSFYGIKPWQRIIIAISGPVFNLISAFLFFFILVGIEPRQEIGPNQVIVSTEEIVPGQANPAVLAGLQSGDVIISYDGKPINNYGDLFRAISLCGTRFVKVGFLRSGIKQETQIQAIRDKTYSPKIGVRPWVDPEIGNLPESSPFKKIFLPKDKLVSINGFPVKNSFEVEKVLQPYLVEFLINKWKRILSKESLWDQDLTIVVWRNGVNQTVEVPISYFETREVSWAKTSASSANLTWDGLFIEGFQRGVSTLERMVLNLLDLFQGKISILDSLNGPIGIIQVGSQNVDDGFKESWSIGIIYLLQFMTFLSLALFLMNMLPLPALDGGIIVLGLIETLRRKAFSAAFLVRFQQFGVGVILVLLVLATYSDISRLFK